MTSPDHYILRVLDRLSQAIPAEQSLFSHCIRLVHALPSNPAATEYRFDKANRYASAGMSEGAGTSCSSRLYMLSRDYPDYCKQLTDVAAYIAMTGSMDSITEHSVSIYSQPWDQLSRIDSDDLELEMAATALRYLAKH